MKIRLLLAAAVLGPLVFPSSGTCQETASRSQSLLRESALGEFRPVEHWQGVAEVAAVPNRNEFQLGSQSS